MKLTLGIVGLPNIGKSTLFNALTKKSVLAANYPFATIDPTVGIVSVPDRRLDQLAEFSKSAKKINAAVEFVDIAGLVKGASEGEGLGNQFLSHIRETVAIAQVVRIFDNPNVVHVEGTADPLRDIETVNLELVLADISVVERRLESLAKEIRAGKKDVARAAEAAEKILPTLHAGQLAQSALLTSEEKDAINHLHLLTMKPILYVLNREAGGHNLDEMPNDERWVRLLDFFERSKSKHVTVDANVESDLRDLAPEEKQDFRREYGVFDDGINDLIRAGYDLLGLITFFTTGPDETRGWTIRKGSSAPEAGAAIHTDFRDKFIRAEVIPWNKLLESGSYANARARGLVRTEGKEYVVEDGDVVEFLHS